MLFNSYQFLFGFLPVVLVVSCFLAKWSTQAVKVWLIFASFFFYSWWRLSHLPVILGAMLFTYYIGIGMLRTSNPRKRKLLLIIGLVGDIGLLGYFKYFNFFVDTVNAVVRTSIHIDPILLPLAISFFIFQKIAFLMDVYQGKVQKVRFWDYCLFVAFFPQLIAGPIVHYRELMPQFQRPKAFDFQWENFSIGLTIFTMGLFKKVLIADSIAPTANHAFEILNYGIPTTADAWIGVAAYGLQLYYDFSGYSDMAIGLARMFNILLPLNFNSPYKSESITEFWRRWHITLSHFLRDYIYIPLGGNRDGKWRQFANLSLTMMIGGLWHGAGWTFVIWGVLHGTYLIINHAWMNSPLGRIKSQILRVPAWLLTYVCILIGWAFFRAPTVSAAWKMLHGMFHAKHFALKALTPIDLYCTAILLLASLVLPNTQQLLARFHPALNFEEHPKAFWTRFLWRPGFSWGLVVALLLGLCICGMARPSRFLYFQF